MDLNRLKIDTNSLGPVRQSRRMTLAPCEVRVREVQERLEHVRRTEPKKYYAELCKYAVRDYWIFLRLVLCYNHLDPWDHGEELVHFIQTNLGSPMLFLVPRGGGKSTTITVPLMPWLIARDPTITGIITNVREEKAKRFAKDAAAMITNSENYRRCFPYVRPTDKWGEGGYIIEAQKSQSGGATGRVDPTISSYGVGGNITGSHVRAMLHDDLLNEETAKYPSQRARSESFFKESLNCLDPGGVLVCCATRWHYDDLYGKMEDSTLMGHGEAFKVFKRGAERYVLDDEGRPVVEVFNRHRTFVDFRGARQQIGYTPEFLKTQKANLGSLYYALYMNSPISLEDRLLAVEQVRTFSSFNTDLAPCKRMGIEVVSAAIAFWDTFVNSLREHKITASVDRIKPANRSATVSVEKHARIKAVVGSLIDKGRLWIREDLFNRDGNIGQEIREFDKGKDDALDALTYCIMKAPKHLPGTSPEPYIAVDPAFTANQQSDFTAILAGCWYGEDFYVLDCHLFKAQKTDLIIHQILSMYYKFKDGKENIRQRPSRNNGFVSPGQIVRRRTPKITWGSGLYTENDGNQNESQEGSSQQNPREQDGFGRWGNRLLK